MKRKSPDFRLDELAKKAGTIGISGHIRPDGDCVGSTLGLMLYLKKRFPDKQVELFLEQLPREFCILAGSDEIRLNYKTNVKRFDLFFSLDCGKERLGEAERFFDEAEVSVNIDHHVSNPGTGMHNYIVPDASSTSELIYELLDREYMDADIAQAIYMGIVHDTGVFQYSNTAPVTLRRAAELISYGFDFSALITKTFYEKSFDQNRILGQALLNARLFLKGLVIGTVLTNEEMEAFHIHPGQLDGIVSKLRETRGVDCAILIYPLANGSNKVSLRSSGITNVAKIAEDFGGGGHVRAAGCDMQGALEENLQTLVEKVKQQLISAGMYAEDHVA